MAAKGATDGKRNTKVPKKQPKGRRAKQTAKPRKGFNLQSLFHNWQSKIGSLIIAIFIYSFYQAAIQVEVSFVLPLSTIGAQDRIVRLRDVTEVTLRLAGRTQDLENLRSTDFEAYIQPNPNENGIQSLPVQYRLRNNNLQLNSNVTVYLEPDLVSLLVEKKEMRNLPIEVNLQGYPATGQSLGTYSVYPDSVSVTGPVSVLEKLESISTKIVDITGKNRPFQEQIELELPSIGTGDSAKSNLHLAFDRVQVVVQIDARSETQTFPIVPQVVNLPSSLALLSILPDSVQLTVQGSSEVLQRITADSSAIKIELDAGDIFAPGRYALPVPISDLPPSISLLNSSPNRVSVVIGER